MFDNPERQGQIFRAEDCLSTRYTPDQAIGREAEIEQITAAVKPLARRRTPENLLIYGPAGAGKTTVVTHVCEQLADQSRVQPVRLNCWQYNTRPALLSQLLIELGYPTPRKGKAVDELLSQLREWLDKNHRVLAVLDEFDRHRAQTDVIYDLHTLSETAATELGLILISNKPPDAIELDPRSESRLHYRALKFAPYAAEDLIAILQDRTDAAFYDDVVADEALNLIAERVAAKSGDCRHAIELLHRAGRTAEREQAETVTSDHVNESRNPARG